MITDLSDHTKKIIFHPKMLPAIVIADPELTVGLPAQVTAATGMDALSHCLEAWCSPFYHPMAEGIAAEGMRLVRHWLPTAVNDGANVEARAHMLVASSMGATAFQKGLGAMHSLSHPCGANLNTHHGLTNAVVMPYVLAWNRRAIDDKMVRLAAYLGLQRQSFDGFLDWVLQLRADIGIPRHARGHRRPRGTRRGLCAAGPGRPVDGRQPARDDRGRLPPPVPQLHPRGSCALKAFVAASDGLRAGILARPHAGMADGCGPPPPWPVHGLPPRLPATGKRLAGARRGVPLVSAEPFCPDARPWT